MRLLHGTPAQEAHVWLTTIRDLDRETKALVALKQAFAGRPDVVAREAAHRAMHLRLSDQIDVLPKRHEATITRALVGAGFVV